VICGRAHSAAGPRGGREDGEGGRARAASRLMIRYVATYRCAIGTSFKQTRQAQQNIVAMCEQCISGTYCTYSFVLHCLCCFDDDDFTLGLGAPNG
jgi:hypothetical protein